MAYKTHMSGQHLKVFQMRASEEFLRRIDDWRREQPDLPSRAESIRRLVEIALNPSPTPKVAARKKAAPAKS
jgi:hypothetical protein